MGVAIFQALGDGLAIGHLGLTHFHLNAVGPFQNVHLNVEVQLTHPLQNGFAALFIGFHPERGILLNHLAQGDPHFLAATLLNGFYRNGDHRVGEDHRLQSGGLLGIAQGVTGLDVLHPHQGHNVASLGRIHFLTGVGVHFYNPTNPLGLAGEGVQDGVALVQGARVQASKSQSAVLVVHNLECQSPQRQLGIHLGKATGFVTFQVNFRLRGYFFRVGQVIHNRIQH